MLMRAASVRSVLSALWAPSAHAILAALVAWSAPATASDLPAVALDTMVTDLAGARAAPFRLAPGEFALVVFVTHDCPIANALAPEVGRVCSGTAARGVRCRVVYLDPLADRATLARHFAEYHVPGVAAAHDPRQLLAAALGITATPEAVVVDARGQVRYRGRINDRFPALGQARPQPRRHDLRRALDELLGGKPVSVPSTEAVGCALPLVAP